MHRSALFLILTLAAPARAQPLQELSRQLQSADTEAASALLRRFFDGGPKSAPVGVRDYERLRQERELLSLGTPQKDGSWVNPFTFHVDGGGDYTAPSAGLEGFVYAEEHLPKDAVRHHLEDYGRYLDALLAPIPWAADARARAQAILKSDGTDAQRYDRLMDFARAYTETLRREVAASDRAQWVRDARIYEIFPRAYNLAGKREAAGEPPGPGGPFFADLGTRDLLDIKAEGFDAVWVMGIFPIGQRDPFGTAGGSPYSVKDHEGINPELGSMEDFRGFVGRAHDAGLKVLIDFIPNHTSMDSKLLLTHPEFFLHRDADPARPDRPDRGYFVDDDPVTGRKLWVRHGGYDSYGHLEFWTDTAQVDYSNEALRREMVRIVRGWVEGPGVDGFRVDMAYQVLNGYFGRNWGLRMPPREFLEELITSVKAAYPATAFIAEGYDGWDSLSYCGFDLIYGKNDMNRPGGHAGWYDSLASRDPGRIQEAIKRAEFLQWQKGGSGALDFIGNHDEASPRRAFGAWSPGASFLTLLMPGGLLFYGSQEIGFDRPNLEKEPKSIPFGVPVSVDWKDADPAVSGFYHETFQRAVKLRRTLKDPRLQALPPPAGRSWVGYTLGRGAAAVLANPTDRAVQVSIGRPEWSGTLPPYGWKLVEDP